MKSNKIRRVLICALSAIIILSPLASADAVYDSNADNAAKVLNTLGLLLGSKEGYALERTPSRAEGFVMLIRFIGAEATALAGNYAQDCPFSDISGQWFEPYARYAWEINLTNGVGGDLFAPSRAISSSEYSAMLLRALEYDFSFNDAVKTAKNAGIFNYYADSGNFNRGDMALMSYGALFCINQKTGISMLQQLLSSGVISAQSIRSANFSAVKPVNFIKDSSDNTQHHTFSIAEKKLYIGMSADEIINIMGNADRIDPSQYDFSWWVYNSDYSAFVMIGVDQNQKAAAFYSNSVGASWGDAAVGGKLPEYSNYSEQTLTVFTDGTEDGQIDGLLVMPRTVSVAPELSNEMIAAAEYQLMDMANAARVRLGGKELIWSGAAAYAAREHSMDMSAGGYFSHTSKDGNGCAERLKKRRVIFSVCAENIAQGYSTAFSAHHAWMNSEEYRKTLLSEQFTHFGAGITADRYYTEDFFA